MGSQEHRVERPLAAIFVADLVSYSRLMKQYEIGTLRTLTDHCQIMDRLKDFIENNLNEPRGLDQANKEQAA